MAILLNFHLVVLANVSVDLNGLVETFKQVHGIFQQLFNRHTHDGDRNNFSFIWQISESLFRPAKILLDFLDRKNGNMERMSKVKTIHRQHVKQTLCSRLKIIFTSINRRNSESRTQQCLRVTLI